ncbi:MAG TPA: PilZ domain-containing protein [Desulfosalsimonadaceae bacterium]|nr:PilZ domain-containing protein [Desulfosalsimonadaceae bacterium]
MSQKIDSDLTLVTSKIYGIIDKMTLEERQSLLTELERHEKGGKSGIRRKYPRKDYLINVDYAVGDRVYNGLAINFSASGMFIETAKSQLPKFHRGNQLILTFSHPETKDNLKITGEIARIDDKGIGVKFDESIVDWWSP